jgi:hypothetical protein
MTLKNHISIGEALAVMSRKDDSGDPIPVDIEIRTFNRKAKKGGTLKKYNTVKLLPLPIVNSKTNHFENRTRNIKLPTGQIKKINTAFIIRLNGKLVSY